MNAKHLGAILADLRALILKSRPAYRDFSVEESEISEIANGVFGDDASFVLSDGDFAGFVLGEKYRVTINGVEQIVTAVDMELGA